MSEALTTQFDTVRKLLRRACARWGATMPADVAAWWAAEQQVMADEQAAADARKAALRADLEAQIAKLQARLAAL